MTQDHLLADISDLTSLDRSHPTPTRARSVRIPPRMDLASKNPPGGPNCDARHDATDILTDTSPAFRPLFAHGLRQRTPVSRSARAAPRSAGASTRTAAASGGSPPAGASSSGVLAQPPTRKRRSPCNGSVAVGRHHCMGHATAWSCRLVATHIRSSSDFKNFGEVGTRTDPPAPTPADYASRRPDHVPNHESLIGNSFA